MAAPDWNKTSATGIWMDKAVRGADASSSGFTLIEIIVVTVIIAVIVSATLLSVTVGERGRAQEVGRRIVSLMNNLSAEAILTGVPYGLRWNDGARRLVAVHLKKSAWTRDERFGGIQVPRNWSLQMSSGVGEGVDLALLGRDEDDETLPAVDEDDPDDPQAPEESRKDPAADPWVRFHPTGLWQPGGILQILVDRDRQAMFGWTATGRVTIGNRAAEELP